MKKDYLFGAIFSSLFLTGCAVTSMSNMEIQKEALLGCGLGYDAETGASINAAYNKALAKKDVDFKTAMNDALETPITKIVKEKMTNENSKDLIKLIKDTQTCVTNEIARLRPKTRKDFLYECRDDIQDSVAGKNRTHPKVKELTYIEKHERNTSKDYVIAVFIDHGGSRSHYRAYVCQTENNVYQGSIRLK